MSKPGLFIIQSICFGCQGDIGPLTTYTNKRQIVVFLKAWLRDPASWRQVAHRDRIRACARNWQTLSPIEKRKWETVTKTLSLYINGYNLWVCMSMNLEARDALPTLCRQSTISLTLPPLE